MNLNFLVKILKCNYGTKEFNLITLFDFLRGRKKMEFSHPFIRFFLFLLILSPIQLSLFHVGKKMILRNLSTRFSDSSKIRWFTFKLK